MRILYTESIDTESTPGTCTKHLHILIVHHILRYIYQQVTAVLHLIGIDIMRISLTRAIEFSNHVVFVTFQRVSTFWTEIDKRTVQERLVVTILIVWVISRR